MIVEQTAIPIFTRPAINPMPINIGLKSYLLNIHAIILYI
jgi:hypothetical protein